MKEAEKRRSGKQDTPNRRAIYLGVSLDVAHGVKVAHIDYDEHKKVWIIGPTLHRSSKNVRVINGNYVLTTREHTEATALDLEKHLDSTTPSGGTAEVYEVEKIHDKQVINDVTYYRISWKGWHKNHKTWEPASNMYEYGAGDMVVEYELKQQDKSKGVRYVNMNKEERAIQHLMGKHGLGGSVQQHMKTYTEEMQSVLTQKLGRKLSDKEVKALKQQGTKIIMTRMNPEWHKPDHDYPEGRSK